MVLALHAQLLGHVSAEGTFRDLAARNDSGSVIFRGEYLFLCRVKMPQWSSCEKRHVSISGHFVLRRELDL